MTTIRLIMSNLMCTVRIKQFKIFRTVVLLVSILMVNCLLILQRAPEGSFHEQPVLKPVLLGTCSNIPIPISSDVPVAQLGTISVSTLRAAVEPLTASTLTAPKELFTVRALNELKFNGMKNEVTLSATEPPFARGIFFGDCFVANLTEHRPSPESIVHMTFVAEEESKVKWEEKTMRVRVTAYDPGRCCTPGLGVTKTGRSAYSQGVAVDPKVIPLGSRLDIPGYGSWILADDTGSRIKGKKLDVRFLDHSTAKEWGDPWLTVRVWVRKR